MPRAKEDADEPIIEEVDEDEGGGQQRGQRSHEARTAAQKDRMREKLASRKESAQRKQAGKPVWFHALLGPSPRPYVPTRVVYFHVVVACLSVLCQ